MEPIFFQLAQLNLFLGLATNYNQTKNKSLSNNCGKINTNISDKVGGKKFITKEELIIKKDLKIEKKFIIENLEDLEQLQ